MFQNPSNWMRNFRKEGSMNLREQKGSVSQASLSLSIAREGFIYRGSIIISKLDEKLRNEETSGA